MVGRLVDHQPDKHFGALHLRCYCSAARANEAQPNPIRAMAMIPTGLINAALMAMAIPAMNKAAIIGIVAPGPGVAIATPGGIVRR